MPDDESRIAEIEELFRQSDKDDNGKIDFPEFAELMGNLDPQMTRSALEIGFRDIDTNKDGRINLDEFLEWWLAD